MPLHRWEVQPESICAKPIPPEIQCEHLQCVSNSTLATIILQLGSITNHAEQLFDSLILDTEGLGNRTNALQQRFKALEIRTQQLDVKTDGASETMLI
jgi:hypothetical protein